MRAAVEEKLLSTNSKRTYAQVSCRYVQVHSMR